MDTLMTETLRKKLTFTASSMMNELLPSEASQSVRERTFEALYSALFTGYLTGLRDNLRNLAHSFDEDAGDTVDKEDAILPEDPDIDRSDEYREFLEEHITP